jgi:hypothetical protein
MIGNYQAIAQYWREGWVKSLQALHGADPLHPHAQILFPGKS